MKALRGYLLIGLAGLASGCASPSPNSTAPARSPGNVSSSSANASGYPYVISVLPGETFDVQGTAPYETWPSPQGWQIRTSQPAARWVEKEREHDDVRACYFRGEVFPCVAYSVVDEQGVPDDQTEPVGFVPSRARGHELIPAFPFNVVAPGVSVADARAFLAHEKAASDLEEQLPEGCPCRPLEAGVGGICEGEGKGRETSVAAQMASVAGRCAMPGLAFRPTGTFEIDDVTRETIRLVHDPRIDPYTYDGGFHPLSELRAGDAVWHEWVQIATKGPSLECARTADRCPVIVVLRGEGRPIEDGFDLLYCALFSVEGEWGAPMECTAVGYQDARGQRFLLAYYDTYRGGAEGSPDLECKCPGLTAGKAGQALQNEPSLATKTATRENGDTFWVRGVRRQVRSLIWDHYRDISTVVIYGSRGSEGATAVTISSTVLIGKQASGSDSYHGLTLAQKKYYQTILQRFAEQSLGCTCTALDLDD